MGCGSGADAGVVFAVGDVADPVQSVFDAPVSSDVVGDLGRSCLVGGEAGEAQDGDRAGLAGGSVGGSVGDVSLDQECLCGMGNRVSPGAGRTWMVRRSMRPWPVSVVACIGAIDQSCPSSRS